MLAALGAVVAAATIQECVRIIQKRPIEEYGCLPVRILHCFSIRSNSRKIFTAATPTGDISCIHGIRVLTNLYIVASHLFSQLTLKTSTTDALRQV